VGKSALEGLKGIKEVKRGFRGFRETNTVIYDPSIITTAEMVSALKAAGTYQGLPEE
jgi:copper chaperone CopZ